MIHLAYVRSLPHVSGVLGVPGLRLLDAWIRDDEAARLIAEVDRGTWDRSLRRRVQQYGAPYSYARRALGAGARAAFPVAIDDLGRRLTREGILARSPDRVIVNEYLPGQGIAPHVDHPSFGPVVASLSLGSPVVMTLSSDEVRCDVVLPPRSLLVLSGTARTQWRHGIAARKHDVIAGAKRVRERRVSLTFRTLR